jgi:hypothetical protein
MNRAAAAAAAGAGGVLALVAFAGGYAIAHGAVFPVASKASN